MVNDGLLTDMCSAILPKHRLHYLGLVVIGTVDRRQGGASGTILIDRDLGLDGP
jgi:hypothetical protein